MIATARYLKRSAAFVARTQLKRIPVVGRREIALAVGDRSRPATIRADVYAPRDGVRARGPIVMIHGMSAYGNRDPRIVDFCSLLTELGHAVVAPQVDTIAAFSTDLGIVDEIEDIIVAVEADRTLTAPGSKVAVLCASFTSLYVLMAACRPSLREKVSAMCFIGGIFTPEAMHAVIRDQDRRVFPRDVFLMNFLSLKLGSRPDLERAFATALLDNSLNRTVPELPRCLAELSEEDRVFFERVRTDPAFRAPYAQAIFEHFTSFLPSRLEGMRDLKATVVLIHGREDPVLPSSDSEALYRDLVSLGVRAHLDITPLLAHGEPLTFHPRLVGPALRIVDSFARFFRAAAEP